MGPSSTAGGDRWPAVLRTVDNTLEGVAVGGLADRWIREGLSEVKLATPAREARRGIVPPFRAAAFGLGDDRPVDRSTSLHSIARIASSASI